VVHITKQLRILKDANGSSQPNQPGRLKRLCIHEKTQGIARILDTSVLGARAAGREPICKRLISSNGVADCQKCRKPGVSYTNPDRPGGLSLTSLSFPCARHQGLSAELAGEEAIKTAWTSVRDGDEQARGLNSARNRLALFGETKRPLMVPTGWARMALFAGPPPRAMVPPRPWNMVNFILYISRRGRCFSAPGSKPVCSDISTVLVTVRIADHDHLGISHEARCS